MELAIPIFYDGEIYNAVEIEKPRTKVISLASEVMEKSGVFRAMIEFINGCVKSFSTDTGETVTDKLTIRKLTGLMPYITAEAVALKIMTEINEDDTLEGIYPCPRCGENFIAEYDSVTEEDTRDKISDLEIICMDDNDISESFLIELSSPVKIKNAKTDELIEEIENIELRYANLNDCINGTDRFKKGQEIQLQNHVYLNSLVKVNGKDIDKKWTAAFGKILFDSMYPKDLLNIGQQIQKYGLKKTVLRYCRNCSKEWEAPVNTANFFALGLQQV